MPIFDVGYRHWEGKLRSPLARCWTIARTGIVLAFRSVLLRRLVLFGWAPLLYFAPAFFAVGYVTDPVRDYKTITQTPLFGMLRDILGPEVAERMRTSPESIRPMAWSILFQWFFSISQAIITMLVVGIVGPPLISQDVRSKAFLIYYSKPITLPEYLMGKAGTLLFFIAVGTVLPALMLYGVSIAFSPSAAALVQTWATIVRILSVFFVIAVPSTLLVLCLSSLVKESRYAAFGWMAFCLMGEMAYGILANLSTLSNSSWICCVSFRKTIAVLTSAIFDVQNQVRELGLNLRHLNLEDNYPPQACATWLILLSSISLVILVRRVSAPVRI
jgi:ABC-2 type transport system permease protein